MFVRARDCNVTNIYSVQHFIAHTRRRMAALQRNGNIAKDPKDTSDLAATQTEEKHNAKFEPYRI